MKMEEQKKRLTRIAESRSDVLTRLEEVEERRAKLTDGLADLEVDGGSDAPEATELRRRRRALDAEARELKALLEVLNQKRKEARKELDDEALEDLFRHVRKVCGGLAGEYPNHVARAEEFEAKARDARLKAEEAAERSGRLRDAVLALGSVVGVDPGEIRAASGPGRSPRDLQHKISLGQTRRAGRFALSALAKEDLLSDEARAAIEDAIEKVTDGQEAETFKKRQQAERDEQAEERETARQQVDAWLGDLLRDGPVLRDRVARAAREKGFPIRRDAYHASVADARRRLGVVPVERIEDPRRRSWWALPETWSSDNFRPIDDGSTVPASAIR